MKGGSVMAYDKILKMNVSLSTLKAIIKRRHSSDRKMATYWFSEYKRLGGKLSYKEIIES